MNRLTIELLDPRVKALLEDLAKLDLIRITESPDPQGRFAGWTKYVVGWGGFLGPYSCYFGGGEVD